MSSSKIVYTDNLLERGARAPPSRTLFASPFRSLRAWQESETIHKACTLSPLTRGIQNALLDFGEK